MVYIHVLSSPTQCAIPPPDQEEMGRQLHWYVLETDRRSVLTYNEIYGLFVY